MIPVARAAVARWAVAMFVVAAALGAASCASGAWREGVYRSNQVWYDTGTPDASWRPVSMPQANMAWHAASLDAALLVNSHCAGVRDAPLETLTNDLWMGTTERSIERQDKQAWSKREALETVGSAKLDGVLRKYAFFVLKKDGCVYDIVLNAAPETFAAAWSGFAAVKAGFDVRARPDRNG